MRVHILRARLLLNVSLSFIKYSYFLRSSYWKSYFSSWKTRFIVLEKLQHEKKINFSQINFEHGTIIRTGISCTKIPCYMHDSACRWIFNLLLKQLKYFEVINIFEFSWVWENVESWLVYANKLFWIAQPYFSTDIIKRN